MDRTHDHEQSGHRRDREPGTGEELGNDHDEQDAGGDDAAGAVDETVEVHPHARLGLDDQAQPFVPVEDHACLTHDEAGEDADEIELDQCRRRGLSCDDEQDSGEGQEQDAVRERQPIALRRQLPGQESVACQPGGEAGESFDRGVRGDDEHERCDEHNEVEHHGCIVEDRMGQLRENRFLFVFGADRAAVGSDQVEMRIVDVFDPRSPTPDRSGR